MVTLFFRFVTIHTFDACNASSAVKTTISKAHQRQLHRMTMNATNLFCGMYGIPGWCHSHHKM